jgi:hypothetical protein
MPNIEPRAKNEGTVVKRDWVSPTVTELPPLTNLTLQTGPGIPGGFSIGGTRIDGLSIAP